MFADDTESFCIGDSVNEIVEDCQITVNKMENFAKAIALLSIKRNLKY